MAKKKTTETAENAAVNQESKEPKKKQEDILLEMIQRYLPYEKRNLYPYPQNERKTGSLQFERQSAENQAQKYVQG